ncbi:MAG: sortase [Oscillospiraceae bacterium]|nr:sortase [Oscillospiraceae bacterium]
MKKNKYWLYILICLMILNILLWAYYDSSLQLLAKNETDSILDYKQHIINTTEFVHDNDIMSTNNITETLNKTKKENSNLNTSDNKDLNNQTSTKQTEYNNDKDCIIRIPDIQLEKIVYTGNHREQYLKDYGFITATYDMQYINGGNYIICGHASRLYGHSLNRIKELQKGSQIYIDYENGTDTFIVTNIAFKDRNNCSEYFEQTNTSNILTIISCARYVTDTSYIIIQAQKQT